MSYYGFQFCSPEKEQPANCASLMRVVGMPHFAVNDLWQTKSCGRSISVGEMHKELRQSCEKLQSDFDKISQNLSETRSSIQVEKSKLVKIRRQTHVMEETLAEMNKKLAKQQREQEQTACLLHCQTSEGVKSETAEAQKAVTILKTQLALIQSQDLNKWTHITEETPPSLSPVKPAQNASNLTMRLREKREQNGELREHGRKTNNQIKKHDLLIASLLAELNTLQTTCQELEEKCQPGEMQLTTKELGEVLQAEEQKERAFSNQHESFKKLIQNAQGNKAQSMKVEKSPESRFQVRQKEDIGDEVPVCLLTV
eukprot:g25303.t1